MKAIHQPSYLLKCQINVGTGPSDNVAYLGYVNKAKQLNSALLLIFYSRHVYYMFDGLIEYWPWMDYLIGVKESYLYL